MNNTNQYLLKLVYSISDRNTYLRNENVMLENENRKLKIENRELKSKLGCFKTKTEYKNHHEPIDDILASIF